MLANINEVASKVFDYVIIGGGTAGLCVAARLSEDPSVSVLVLEAGEANLQDPDILSTAGFVKTLGNPKYDWAYFTTEQPQCADRKMFWPRGKGLGGSSALNFFLWSKPSKFDMDAFERLGNPGWNWASFDKYAKKAERFAAESVETNKDLLVHDNLSHGTDGPIITSFPPITSGMEKPVQDAMSKLGVKVVKNAAGGYSDGYGSCVIPSTVDPTKYTRSYSASAYFEPNAGRKNLTVLVSAHVAEIVTTRNSDGTVTATEVKFIHEQTTHSVKVKNEVTLCAGAINSPQILELSGIGEKSVLSKAGIDVTVELPGVGNNVQDHYYSVLTYEIKESLYDKIITMDAMRDPEIAKEQIALYAERKGLLTMYMLGLMFAPLEALTTEAGKINEKIKSSIEAGIKEGRFPPGLQKQYTIQLERIKEQQPSYEILIFPGVNASGLTPELGKKHISLTPAINHPFSRGSIHVSSKDPLAPPVIDPAVFKEEHDLIMMVELVKFSRKVAQIEPLASMLSGHELRPGSDVLTDEQIAEQFVKPFVSTTYHTSSSCSMLPKADGGVVDSKLKVYGTTNIRVAETSIIPLHISAHTQAIAYAIGEQAADIIKGVA